ASSRCRTGAGSPCIPRSTPHKARRCKCNDATRAGPSCARDGARVALQRPAPRGAASGMTFPSFTLLAQSALSGVFIGSLYGLLGLGIGLSWGLLHIINLAHFGFAFLAAYLCYQLASVGGMDPLLTLALIVPLFFLLGVAVQWLLARFSVSPLNSLLATVGLTAIIEAGIQAEWTADFR